MDIKFNKPIEITIHSTRYNKLKENPDLSITQIGVDLYLLDVSQYENIEILNIKYTGKYGYATIVAYRKYNNGKIALNFSVRTVDLFNGKIDYEIVE